MLCEREPLRVIRMFSIFYWGALAMVRSRVVVRPNRSCLESLDTFRSGERRLQPLPIPLQGTADGIDELRHAAGRHENSGGHDSLREHAGVVRERDFG